MQQHLGATVLYCWKCFFEPISLPKVRRVSWPEKAWVFYIICISYFPLHLRHSIAFIYLTWLAPPWLAVYGQSWPSDLGIFDIVEQPASRSERFELRQFNVFKIVQITILWSLFLITAKLSLFSRGHKRSSIFNAREKDNTGGNLTRNGAMWVSVLFLPIPSMWPQYTVYLPGFHWPAHQVNLKSLYSVSMSLQLYCLPLSFPSIELLLIPHSPMEMPFQKPSGGINLSST